MYNCTMYFFLNIPGQLVWEMLEREWLAGEPFCKIFKVLLMKRENKQNDSKIIGLISDDP